MTGWVGIGRARGVCVAAADAWAFAVQRLDMLPAADRRQLHAMLRMGLMASELTDWYFSGNFARKSGADATECFLNRGWVRGAEAVGTQNNEIRKEETA